LPLRKVAENEDGQAHVLSAGIQPRNKTKVSKSTGQFFYITPAEACQENTTGSGEENQRHNML